MGLTKQQLEALNNNSFPNNNAGAITPAILRDYNDATIANTVNQDVYTTDSASFNTRIEAITASVTINTGSFATTGSNTFVGAQTITGSHGKLVYDGSSPNPNVTLAEIHSNDEYPWFERFYNDTFSTSSSVMSYFGWNDGRFVFHNDSTQSIGIGINGEYNAPELLVYEDKVVVKNDLYVSGNVYATNLTGSGGNIDTGSFATTGSNTFIGGQTIEGNITFPSGSFISSTNVSGNLYLASLNGGLLQLNTDGGEGDVLVGSNGWNGKLKVRGNSEFTGSQTILSGSIAVLNNGNAASLNETELSIETYTNDAYGIIAANNHSASLGIISWDGATYDNELWIQADNSGIQLTDWDNGIGNLSAVPFISVGANDGSQPAPQFQRGLGITGSMYQSGTFYADQIDVSRGGIIQTTGSYVMTYSGSGLVTYDTYQNVATALQPYIQTGSTLDTSSFATTGSNTFVGNQTVTGSTNFTELTGSLATFSASVSTRINNATGSGGGAISVQEEGSILGDATSFNFLGAGVTATFSAGTASITIAGGGGATTGSNTFTGDQTILGSIVSNPTTSLTELFSQAFVSGATQYNITASNATSQSNIVLGGTPLASTSNGSIIISGSGNVLFNPSKIITGASAFTKGYVGGNNNYFTVIPTLHTQSLFNPAMTNNIGTGTLTMNFITSSLGVPSFSNNNFSNTITLNHQSGTMAMTNNISNGTITSTQNGLTSGTVGATITQNVFGNNTTLNHNSSSITTTFNGIFGQTTINNNYYHTGSNNNISFANNLTNGSAIVYNIGGSPSTNVFRPIVGNLIGGQTITIQADVTGSDLGGVRNEVVYGYNLIVSGAQSTAGTTQQGGAFFGRWNDINNMYADTGKTVFAVGTGTSTSNRKTALSVDSASVVNVSGSLSVTGSSTFSGSMAVSGTINTITISSAGDVTASRFLATSNVGGTPGAFAYSSPSSGSVPNTFNTSLGKDFIDIFQYQSQPYAFNLHLTSDQLNTYTGSQFLFQLQKNGSNVNLPIGGGTYFAMVSGSTIIASVGGTIIPGLDVLESAMCLDFKAPSTFESKVYIDKGLYVSQSSGGGTPALILNGSVGSALLATGSVTITGSLNLNGQTGFASLGSNTFTSTQIVSSSIYIASNNNSNQLYLPSGSNKQTGTFVLNGSNPGTATISNSLVTANSLIFLTKQTNTNSGNGTVSVTSKGSGTFSVTSDHNGDTDTVAFMIINPS